MDNTIPVSRRQLKKQKREQYALIEEEKWVDYLEDKWKTKINYTCRHCLQEAYLSEINDVNGYVTDDEILESYKRRKPSSKSNTQLMKK